jgi:hypothetical protein
MKRMTLCAAVVAAALWGSTAFAGEKIRLPSGPAKATPQVTTAIDRGQVPVTNVNWARRAWRNGWYGAPYYSLLRHVYPVLRWVLYASVLRLLVLRARLVVWRMGSRRVVRRGTAGLRRPWRLVLVRNERKTTSAFAAQASGTRQRPGESMELALWRSARSDCTTGRLTPPARQGEESAVRGASSTASARIVDRPAVAARELSGAHHRFIPGKACPRERYRAALRTR